MLVRYTAEGVYFASKQEPNCGYRLEVRFHFFFFLQFLQIKVSDKDQREDMQCNLQVGNVK